MSYNLYVRMINNEQEALHHVAFVFAEKIALKSQLGISSVMHLNSRGPNQQEEA